MKFRNIMLLVSSVSMVALLSGCLDDGDDGGSADTFSVNGTTISESGDDPGVAGHVAPDGAGMVVMAVKGFNASTGEYQENYVLTLTAGTAGTYSSSAQEVIPLFAINGTMYWPVNSTASIVTVNSVGAVGEKISGSYDATLCPLESLDWQSGDCSVQTTHFTGSFSVTREPDQAVQ